MNQVRTIGDILVATGRLSQDDAARIVERQHTDKVQFGDAALALKVLTKDDIDFALSKQFDYAYLSDQDDTVSHELVAAYKPFSRVGENLRAVRSQLMLRWFNTDPAHKVIAIVSPGSGEGRSFIAANLAIVFAQQGERTLLIDADLRAKPARAQNACSSLAKAPACLASWPTARGSKWPSWCPACPAWPCCPPAPLRPTRKSCWAALPLATCCALPASSLT